MEKRVELEKRNRNPAEIKELVLDNCRATQVEGLSDEFINLKFLSMNNVGLSSLKGLPKLENLQRLEMSDNKLTGDLSLLSSACPNLTHLNLAGNPNLKDYDSFQPLTELKKLKSLDLFGCGVSNQDDYREKMFGLLPDLQFLDGLDQDDLEEEEDEEEEGDEEDDFSDEDEVQDGVVDDEEEDVEEEEEEDEDDEEDDEETGLEYLQRSQLDEDDDEEEDDFVPGDESGDGADEESGSDVQEAESGSDEDEDEPPAGKKQKLDDD